MPDSVIIEFLLEMIKLACSIKCQKGDSWHLSFGDTDWGYDGEYLLDRACRGRGRLCP